MFGQPHRPSILNRSIRNEAKANVENLEAEYQKEQQRIAAKSERQRSTEERLIRSYYGTEAEKRSGWEATQQELQQHAQARAAALHQEQQREEKWLGQPQQVYVDTQRPWSAHSTTYYLSAQEENEARRKESREAAEQNRLMMQYRSFQQQQEREVEREAIQRTVQSEDAWFNRGASSDRWIPPEHRVKHRAVIAPQFAPAPAPYHCDVDDVPRPSTAPAGGGGSFSQGPPGRRQAYWESESGQGAKGCLNHDVYIKAERSVQRAAKQMQSQQVQAAAAQGARPGQQVASRGQQQGNKYPWSWDT